MIIRLLSFCLFINGLSAEENPENIKISSKNNVIIPSSLKITELKVCGLVTTSIPFTVLSCSILAIWAQSQKEVKDRLFKNEEVDALELRAQIFWAGLSLVVTSLTALIPFHFFMKAKRKDEKRQQIIASRSLLGRIKATF